MPSRRVPAPAPVRAKLRRVVDILLAVEVEVGTTDDCRNDQGYVSENEAD